MKRLSPVLLAVQSALLVVITAHVAIATTVYTDVGGTNVSFTGIQETSTFGDPEPLFEQPVGAGINSLLFFPSSFLANATQGASDQTGSQLELTISANGPLDTIDTLSIDVSGDANLVMFPPFGTAATNTSVSMSGFVKVTETAGGPIAPVIINFIGTVLPNPLALPGDFGTNVWSGSVVVDVASVVPNATKAVLSYDNDLSAASEVGNSAATIQTKVVAVTVVPEPSTLLLAGLGLLGLAGYGWRHRRSR